MTTHPKAIPCPGCGSENITSNEWWWATEVQAAEHGDEHGGVFAFECMDCLFAAPIQSWQRRASPWRYPPDMPAEGERILQTYRNDDGSESPEVFSVWNTEYAKYWDPLIRWMPIPPAPEVTT